MLLSTRNFLLYLVLVGVLVVGVTTTVLVKRSPQEATVIMGAQSETEPTYEAEAVVPEKLNRVERLASMRAKIAALGDSIFSAPEPEVAVEAPAVAEDEEAPRTEPLLCSSYQPDTRSWNPGPVTFTVVEGARLVTREVAVATTTASGTPLTTMETQVVLQLPLRSAPLDTADCLPTDVVGIAKDGSLIRNDEVKLYTVFGADTLVGYALDGFPMYGTGSGASLDECGGTSTLGQYRYYLDAKRTHILNCFAGEPVKL